jgi:hypothetical protein
VLSSRWCHIWRFAPHYKDPVNPWRKNSVQNHQKTITMQSATVSDIIMDWPPWRFSENHHRITKSMTILNHHSRAQCLVSPAKPIFNDAK